MIYTVTFNPAVDYIMRIPGVKLGETNRSKGDSLIFGGKGINVSVILRELGVDSVALGFIAGFTGEAIEKGVRERGVTTDFIRLPSGTSRINVKLKSEVETELNGTGPDIDDKSLSAFFEKLTALRDGDLIVLAGSIPGSLPPDIYERILEKLSDRDIWSVVDATKDLLKNVLKYRPYLIKPNSAELAELFGVEIKNDGDVVKYARRLQDMGARNVIVSMAGDGAILVDETGGVHRQGVCRGTVVNSAGAGDSMVAGFIAGAMTGDSDYALKLGTAAGGATAFSEGMAERELIDELLRQL